MARVIVFGGVAESLITFRGPLLKEMVKLGHEVFACAPRAPKIVRDKLREIDVEYREVKLKRTGMNIIYDVYSIITLVNLFNTIKPDVVLGYTIKPVIYGSIAARLVNVPSINSMITGLGFVFSNLGIKNSASRLFASYLYKMALKFNRVVFFQNKDDLKFFMTRGLIGNLEKTVMINGSGVDLELFKPQPLPKTISFLMIARLNKDKGILEYAQAAQIVKKKYPEVKFILVGFIDGNPSSITKQELQTWIDSGILEYLGYLLDVRPAIANSAVYVLPSFREGTPHSVLEAMAMGRPIITTDAPGCRETVRRGENGFLVPIKNVPALVEAIEYFIKNPGDIEVMGQASRRIAVEKYNVNDVNAEILKAMDLG